MLPVSTSPSIETRTTDTEITASLADVADLIRVPENPQLVVYIAPKLVLQSSFLPMGLKRKDASQVRAFLQDVLVLQPRIVHTTGLHLLNTGLQYEPRATNRRRSVPLRKPAALFSAMLGTRCRSAHDDIRRASPGTCGLFQGGK